MHAIRSFAVAALVAATGLAASAPADAAPRAPRDLRILITNDDGWLGAGGAQSPLIAQLRETLVAEGHDVTVVAPASDQSGTGTKLTFATPLTLANPEPKVWTVTGSPGDSVFLGLDAVFAAAKPDLVVSGINPGGNYSALANHSGTVSAAIAALESGVPSIAVSIDGNAEQSKAKAAEVAAYTGRLIDRITKSARTGEVLPTGLGLNVNYPGKQAVTGQSITRQDPTSYTAFKYLNRTGAAGAPGTYQFTGGAPVREPRSGSDWAAINAGKISITPIDADRTADSLFLGRALALTFLLSGPTI